MKTDFALKTIPIGKSEYVQVDERLRAFHKYYDGHIETEVLQTDTCIDQLSGKQAERYVVVARVYPYSFDMEADEHTRSRFYSGSASEISTQGFINKTSALENCETSAIGRALGIMGIGLDNGVASYQEVKQAKKLQEQAMARSTDYSRVDKKVNTAVKMKLISNEQKIEYMKKRSEGMLIIDLLEMEKRLDKMITESEGK
jgi:hypothetical protein